MLNTCKSNENLLKEGATGFAGLNEKGQPQWRSVKGDEIGFALARQLGREAVSLAARLR